MHFAQALENIMTLCLDEIEVLSDEQKFNDFKLMRESTIQFESIKSSTLNEATLKMPGRPFTQSQVLPSNILGKAVRGTEQSLPFETKQSTDAAEEKSDVSSEWDREQEEEEEKEEIN